MSNGSVGTTQQAMEESSLSSWAGPYVTEMLGRGQAAAAMPYQAYQGPLTAGQSGLQQQAYQGLGALNVPLTQMGAYTPGTFTDSGVAQAYMSPYVQMSLEPQIAEARRQAEISRVQQAGRLGRAGAYGGSRQAIMESEGERNLLRNLADIYGTGMQQAYTAGMGQFNTEEQRRQAAQDAVNRFGLEALAVQRTAGAEQRAIEGEGIAADYKQFLEERDYPYRQATYMQSLLSSLPLETQSYTIDQPSGLQRLAGAYGDIESFLEEYGII